MARAVLITPPYVKYGAGPFLGTALLASAGMARGHEVELLDLNIRWIRRFVSEGQRRTDLDPAVPFVGDHAKQPELLTTAQAAYIDGISSALPRNAGERVERQPSLTLPLSHGELTAVVESVLDSEIGTWLREHLVSLRQPDLVGLSVLYSGQIISAVAVAVVAKQVWPDCSVVFGGPHITVLGDAIAADADYGMDAVDGFIVGHAEVTFVELLDSVENGTAWPREVFAAGSGRCHRAKEELGVVPRFDELGLYGLPRLVLPVQLSRGCPYGRCRFCTYSPVEGQYRRTSLDHLAPVIQCAVEAGAVISFKDSLVTPGELRRISSALGGVVPWSACAKLHPGINDDLAYRLANSGCRTIELGLETLVPTAQTLIAKKQSPELFRKNLRSLTEAGVSVVINVITGFPHQTAAEEARWLSWIRLVAAEAANGAPVRVEQNRFELERMAAFARDPERFGIRIVDSWPWSSVLRWRPVAASSALATE